MGEGLPVAAFSGTLRVGSLEEEVTSCLIVQDFIVSQEYRMWVFNNQFGKLYLSHHLANNEHLLCAEAAAQPITGGRVQENYLSRISRWSYRLSDPLTSLSKTLLVYL